MSGKLSDAAYSHDELHSTLLKKGHVSLPGLVLPVDLVSLRQCSADLLEGPSEAFSRERFDRKSKYCEPVLFKQSGKNTQFYDPLGMNRGFDSVLNRILNQDWLTELLVRVLGTEFRLWHLLIRKSEPGVSNLVIHQDLPGEVGLAIFLDDTLDGLGSTCFLDGSHRWPRLRQSNTRINPKWLQFALTTAHGKAGDGYLFYNSTWHGLLNSSEVMRSAIIMTFVPTRICPNLRLADQELIDRVGGRLGLHLSGKPIASNFSASVVVGPDEIVRGIQRISIMSPSRLVHVMNLIYRLLFGVLAMGKRLKAKSSRTKSGKNTSIES